jgi:hypothetical protein
MTSPGEERAWEILRDADPLGICRNAAVSFDEKTNAYLLRSYCMDFQIKPEEKTIKGMTFSGQGIIERYGYFFKHSCLWYLVCAQNIPLTGNLVKPVNIKGGEMFFRGSHVLPLDSLAKRYGAGKEAFLNKGKELCAESLNFGDASLKLLPMPRVPVTLILWLTDEEFSSRTDLLLDASCEIQLPIDIIWSISMLSVLAML